MTIRRQHTETMTTLGPNKIRLDGIKTLVINYTGERRGREESSPEKTTATTKTTTARGDG